MSQTEIIGNFINIDSCAEGEYLQLGFQPSSVPLKQRWRNNGLSADFLGDYVTTFFPRDESDPRPAHARRRSRVLSPTSPMSCWKTR